MLKTATIFSVPLFKVQSICGDSPTRQETGSSIANTDFGGTTRQEMKSLEVGYETSGIASEGYSILFTFFNLYVSTAGFVET